MDFSMLKMKLLTVLLLVNCSWSLAQQHLRSNEAEAPWFCHNIGCPKFENITEKDGKYEVRKYPADKWVSTEIQIKSENEFNDAVNTGFMRLFKYISGENEDKAKISMTSPVLTKVVPGEGPFCKSTLQVSFFVPSKNANNAPKPTDEKVFFTNFEGTVFVKNFKTQAPGPDGKKVTSEATEYGQSLSEDNMPFVSEPYYFAAYDPPFRLFNRHDEIWFVKKGKDDLTPDEIVA